MLSMPGMAPPTVTPMTTPHEAPYAFSDSSFSSWRGKTVTDLWSDGQLRAICYMSSVEDNAYLPFGTKSQKPQHNCNNTPCKMHAMTAVSRPHHLAPTSRPHLLTHT
eukprot:4505499-Ditylum_brightwellii.AAC.1